MVELRSGSATNPGNTSAETVPVANTPPSGINMPPTNPSSTESAPSGITPPITRARVAATPNASTPPTNTINTESAHSGVTSPVTKARAAAAAPNVSSSMASPTITRTTVTPLSGRETGGARGGRP
ncbi:dual specificity protein kinase shkD-like [Papaver somniferum]|uniref:dual specificity protein kinase shkD-like n=1 Tax=Papaver somniferum TaxID=3469 RepID=UPI000E701FFF|nr:dual specificity protein kinase shkD-like [Papaver somniferum]